MTYGNPHPNQLAQIQYLRAMFRDVVSDDLLEQFETAILAAEVMPRHEDAPAEHDQFIIGNDPYSDSLILVRRCFIERVAERYAARTWAKTWGQYYGLMGDAGEDLRAHFRQESEYENFEAYFKARLPLDPEQTLDGFWEEYLALSYFGERPPLDDEEFDQSEYEMCLYDGNSDIPDMRQFALEELPLSILKEFATIEGGGMMGGGDFVHLARDRKEELIEAMKKEGFWVTEDQLLVDAAQNSPDDIHAVYLRLYQNDVLDRVASGDWELDADTATGEDGTEDDAS